MAAGGIRPPSNMPVFTNYGIISGIMGENGIKLGNTLPLSYIIQKKHIVSFCRLKDRLRFKILGPNSLHLKMSKEMAENTNDQNMVNDDDVKNDGTAYFT